VPSGIVAAPLLLKEIVPDADSEKRSARAAVGASASTAHKRRAAWRKKLVILE
jgi:hypothetical protein